MLTEKEVATLREAYRRSGGKAWEPIGGTKMAFFDRAIAAGYVKRVDGRCGFEKFKESMIAFTEAGKAALSEKTDA